MNTGVIASLLPSVFQRTVRDGTPIAAVLEVMQSLQEPCERVLGDLDRHFDPRRAPVQFLPFLARWVDLARLFDPLYRESARPDGAAAPISTGSERLRELIAAAARLSQRRGTRAGLLQFLQIATGVAGFVVHEQVESRDGRPIPFHFRIEAPEAAREHEALIRRIAEQEKPAHMTYELRFAEGEKER